MANLKEVRNRITSVNSTMQITSAMKMVSAAKLKRAQDAVTQIRPFSKKISELVSNLIANSDDLDTDFGAKSSVENVLLIPITSNRGLCGGFNAQVIKSTNGLISNKYSTKNVTVLSIGKKASDILNNYSVTDESFPAHANTIFDDITYKKYLKLQT